MKDQKLNDDILDEFIHDLAQSSLNLLEKYNLSNDERVAYIGRAMAEILSIVICAAPPEKATIFLSNICNHLQSVVARNAGMEKIFGLKLGNDLKERFNETFFLSKKPKEKS